MVRWFCVLVFMLAATTPSWCVDESKFMRCTDAAHCSRYERYIAFHDRANAEQTFPSRFVVIPDTVELPDGTTSENARFELKNTVDGSVLTMTVQLVAEGVVRVLIDEPASPRLYERYRVPPDEVLQDTHLAQRAKDSNVVGEKRPTDIVLSTRNASFRVVIDLDPFRLHLEVHNTRVQTINGRQLMNFERYRERPPPPPPPQEPEQIDQQENPVEEHLTENVAVVEPEASENLEVSATTLTQADGSSEDGSSEDGSSEDAVAATKRRRLEEKEDVMEEAAAPADVFPVDAVAFDDGKAWSSWFGGMNDEKAHGPSAVGIDVDFIHGLHVFGFPSHATSLSLPAFSTPYRSWNLDVFEYALNSPMALYGTVPLLLGLHATEPHPVMTGFLWVNPSDTWMHLKKQDNHTDAANLQTWFVSETGVMDFLMFVGPTPQDVVSQYHVATGLPAIPPMFGIAKHQCRWNYIDEADVAQVDAGFDEHEIPYDVMWLDIEHTDAKKYFTWHPQNFPHPEQMIENLASKGRKLVAIVDPHIKQDESYPVYKELRDQNGLLRLPGDQGGASFQGWCWPGNSVYPDFLDARVRQTFGRFYLPSFWKGSSNHVFVWNDMNEPSVFNKPEVTCPRHVLHLDGREHREVHNLYGMFYHRTTYDALLQRDPNQRPFTLSRSFFIGSHRYGAIWTGDNMARWDHLKSSVPMLLNHALAGISFNGADVGGFFGNPDPELMTRWAQQGAWYPFLRDHSHIESKRREPWLFDPPVLNRIRAAAQLRYRFLPVWYTLFVEYALQGRPILRPIWWHASLKDQTIFEYHDEQFLVGDAVMIRCINAPMENPDHTSVSATDNGDAGQSASTVDVYLPDYRNASITSWFDFHTGQPLKTESAIYRAQVTLETIPIFVKAGSILFLKERQRRSSAMQFGDPFTVHVYPSISSTGELEAKGRLFVDDGNSYRFRTAREFVYDELTLRQHDKEVLLENSPLSVVVGSTSASSPSTEEPPVTGRLDSSSNINLSVERVVIWGLRERPTEVVSRAADRQDVALTFYIDTLADDSIRLEIKKPALMLGSYTSKLVVRF